METRAEISTPFESCYPSSDWRAKHRSRHMLTYEVMYEIDTLSYQYIETPISVYITRKGITYDWVKTQVYRKDDSMFKDKLKIAFEAIRGNLT